MRLKMTEALTARIKATNINDYDQMFNLLEWVYNAGYERGAEDALEDLSTRDQE